MASSKWGIVPGAGKILSLVTLVSFVVLTGAFIIKCIRYPNAVKNEFDHPVSVTFFTTFIVCLLLIPGIIRRYNEALALIIWLLGVLMILSFAWFLVTRWISRQQEPANALPPWLLPVVGLLDVPIIGNQFHFPGVRELCLLCFGAGIMLALIFIPIILARLIFQPTMPVTLQPTLLVLILPFAITYSDYHGFSKSTGIAGSVLFYSGLFMLLVAGNKLLLLPACCPFRVGWWSASFPLSAITIASFHYSADKPAGIFQVIPVLLLTVLSLVIAFLFFQTINRIRQKHFLLGDPDAEIKTQNIYPLRASYSGQPPIESSIEK